MSGPEPALQLGTFIRAHLDEVVAEWESFARTLDTSKSMTPLALRDHCREILLCVADDMEVHESAIERTAKSQGLASDACQPESAAATHGALRQLSGFDLVQLVAEFRALRASVLALSLRLMGPGTGASALEEIIRFNEAIDKALADSVKSYAANVASSRDMFLAILGHDLRGPLSSMRMSAALLGKPALAEEHRVKAAARVKRAAVDMGQLITDLLEFTQSRLGGGIPIERAACDLGPICADAVESLRASHPEQEFTLQAEGDLNLRADASRLQQVLSNLLHNAVQHGDPAAGVSLRASGEDDAVVLRVGNGGHAIAADALPFIFEPLVQAPGGRAAHADERSKTSLGLGLFIVREIVLGHGGAITVTSDADEGTVFTIRLPRAAP